MEFVLDSGAEMSVVPLEKAKDYGLLDGDEDLALTLVRGVAGSWVPAMSREIEVMLPGGGRAPVTVAFPDEADFGTECLLSCAELAERYWIVVNSQYLCFHPVSDEVMPITRRATRIKCQHANIVEMSSGAQKRRGLSLSELSLYGMTIESSQPLNKGDCWKCEVSLPGGRVEVTGVVLKQLGAGSGWVLEIREPSSEYVAAMTGLIEAARKGSPAVTIIG